MGEVIRSHDVEKISLSHTIHLAVAHPVGIDETAKADEHLGRDRLVASEALRLGDEAEQPLRIACSEYRHGLKDMTNVEWTPLPAWMSLCSAVDSGSVAP